MSSLFYSPSLPYTRRPLALTAILAVILLQAFTLSATEAVFHIECPPDTTVDCDAEIWDLSDYGTAYIFGYDGPEPAGDPISVDYDLNSCGAGTITRTWVAYDYGNNPHYCSQVIYVAGGGYVDIHWPPDYTISDCTPSTDPEDLPPPYDFPVVDDSDADCAQIMMNYEDLVFEISPPACIKILRKWTVIDWCQYDPNAWNPQGIWKHTQVIKVVPENPPTLTCPDDVTASSGGDCYTGFVHIPPATGMADCGADVIITNNSPYAVSNGADASGNYPLGTTKVVFTASDGCGGKTTCSMYVTVQDKKAPTPICYYGISISLMMMQDGYYMDLQPEFFDKGSFDNCTPASELLFDIEPKRVDCDDIGTIPVKVFVTDASGNSAYCNTIVHVQDNNDICPPTDGLIAGSVTTLDGSSLGDVQVSLTQASTYEMTNGAGEYTFENIPFGQDYTVAPSYSNMENMDGVSTMDLLILLKHILGIEPITDPYMMVAADIDGSGLVNVHDLVALKEMIMKHHHNVPAGTIWQFLDANVSFAPGENPLDGQLPSTYQISGFNADMPGLNFLGIKRGDLSGDVNYGSFGPSVEHRSGPATITVLDQILTAGEETQVSLVPSDWTSAEGLQMKLSFDETMLEIVDYQLADAIESSNSAWSIEEKDGSLVMIWASDRPVELNNSPIVSVRVRAKKDCSVSQALQMASRKVTPEMYNADGSVRSLVITFIDALESDTEHEGVFSIGDNFPNPFNQHTVIPVLMPEAGELLVEIFSSTGALVTSRIEQLPAGQSQVQVSIDNLAGPGVYMCRLTNGATTRSKRILAQTWE